MEYIKIDFNNILKITMMNKSRLNNSTRHITRIADSFIMYAVSEGCLKIQNNDEILQLSEGDICFFEKGDFQKPLGTSECEFYFIHFQADSAEILQTDEQMYLETVKNKHINFRNADVYSMKPYSYISAMLPRKMHVSNKGFFVYFINTLKSNLISGQIQTPEQRMTVSFVVADLLMKLENVYYESMTKNSVNERRIASNVRLIANYVESHCMENISSTDIEKNLLINFDYANRIFKKIMGISIMKYRNRLRINAAKNMLSVTEYNMEQIAEETGFCNKYYFAKCFKRIEGITPSEYKIKCKGDFDDEKNV